MISRFHFLTQDIPDFSHAELAEFACKGGADWVQLRVKNKSVEEWKKIAEETKSVCKKHRAKLIINDNVFIAKEISADGVHLGKEDMNPKEARKILGENFIIGGTANTDEDINRLMENGVDYIGIGPFRFTETKKNLSGVLGLDGIKRIAEKFSNKIPLIAIGGILIGDMETIMMSGIHGIAVSSAINLPSDGHGFSENKTEITKKFISEIKLHSSKILQ